jgi:ACS family hexuronate transporter-like MFS transporter
MMTDKRRAGYYRWVVCALLFFASTVNYVDRQIIGILKPTLQQEMGWSEIDYGNIVSAFQIAYALGLLVTGRLIDRLGTKLGYSVALIVWSVAAMAHAAARTVTGFSVARFALGLGEAGNFPAAIKTVAEWFPRKERALATGIFNSGTNVGAIAAPMVVPWLTITYGWQAAFMVTGAFGLIWIAFWVPLYGQPDRHSRVSPAELAHIRSDPEDPASPVPWLQLLRYRQTWAFAVAKFMTDPIWWLYLFWVPDFLNRNHGINLQHVGPPLIAIYLVADVGSIGGGWLSSALLKRGWSVNRARKTAMLTCAIAVVPIILASGTSNLWLAVAIVALAAAAHQGWSANIFTMTSDMFPRKAVGSVVGIGGMAGAIGGMFIAKTTGWVLQTTGSYLVVFLIAGSAYLAALAIVHVLVPRMDPVKLEQRPVAAAPCSGAAMGPVATEEETHDESDENGAGGMSRSGRRRRVSPGWTACVRQRRERANPQSDRTGEAR